MISNYSISFHDSTIPFLNELVTNKFGLLHFDITEDKSYCINKHVHIILNIDQSGSMSDECKDGRTKMRHILYTLENMLRLFNNHNREKISIYIQSFDDKVYPIIQEQEDIEILINKIKNIKPNGSTDIGKTLISIKSHIDEYLQEQNNINHEIVHILLTDGEITSGITDPEVLKTYINTKNCSNIFIGYGKTHDSTLLAKLASSSKQGQYRFVDVLENAGLVYGEIVHGILYKVLKNTFIECVNAEIYDYNINEWKTNIELDDLSCEQRKDFQIRTNVNNLNEVKIYLKTKEGNIIDTFSYHHAELVDLTKYLFRQKVQEMLYKSRVIEEIYKKPYEEKMSFKKELKNFLSNITNYMKTNNLQEDPFYKTLADDIYICYKTIGTNIGCMFTYSRQISQGRQHTYTCSAINEDELYEEQLNRRKFRHINLNTPMRHIGFSSTFPDIINEDEEDNINTPMYINDFGIQDFYINNNNDDDEVTFDNYNLSNDPISPYKTKGIINMMTTLSKCDN